MKKQLITIINKRLYLGSVVDCRDYIWERAKREGLGLRVHILNPERWVTIPHSKLSEGIVGSKIFFTKFNGRNKQYRLVSFSIRSDTEKQKEKEDQQITIKDYKRRARKLLEIRDKLHLTKAHK